MSSIDRIELLIDPSILRKDVLSPSLWNLSKSKQRREQAHPLNPSCTPRSVIEAVVVLTRAHSALPRILNCAFVCSFKQPTATNVLRTPDRLDQ